MKHPKFLCAILGCKRGWFVPVKIEIGFNAGSGEEATSAMQEMLPGVRYLIEGRYGKDYPVRISVGKAKRA